MSDIKLSQLPEVTSLSPTDIIPNVSSGATSKITLQNLANTLGSTTGLIKSWIEDSTQTLQPQDTEVISDNFVMNNSLLVISSSGDYYSAGPLLFEKRGSLYVGGHTLFVDSDAVNNGVISVAGGLILSGSSTLTGTGIII